MKSPGPSSIAFALFLCLWLLNGVLINSSNLLEFNLQQMGVEAIVERGQFSVEGSATPQLKPGNVDVFEYNNHLYAAKQPGQFLMGAFVYWFLHRLSLSYLSNFLLTSALVTFLTTSLITALAASAVYLLARDLAAPYASPLAPALVALGFGIGTTALPYAGISHHDAIASSLLVAAFYFLFRAAHNPAASQNRWLALAGGMLLGWVITTSMLPALMVGVALLYALFLKRPIHLAGLALGLLVGLAPLLVYDAINFGSPLTLPNIAGDYTDTFFHFDADNFLSKLLFYATFVLQYTPLTLCGLVGLAFLPGHFRSEQVLLIGMIAVLAGYILNIDTVGHCQYGPRYLLPAMPFLALGLIGLTYAPYGLVRSSLRGLTAVIGMFSAMSNVVGAMFGAMYCDIQWYALPYYLQLLSRGKFWSFPLAGWLIVPLLLAVVLLVYQIRPRRELTAALGTSAP